jgi:hypothetical protein
MTPQEFEAAFPKVMRWIEQTLLAHQALARPVASKGFKRLPLYFRQANIDAAKFAAVDRIPMLPLSSIGLTRFKEFERGDYDGITYLDTYFLKRQKAGDESLHYRRAAAEQLQIQVLKASTSGEINATPNRERLRAEPLQLPRGRDICCERRSPARSPRDRRAAYRRIGISFGWWPQRRRQQCSARDRRYPLRRPFQRLHRAWRPI